jgi:hypothetical protein
VKLPRFLARKPAVDLTRTEEVERLVGTGPLVPDRTIPNQPSVAAREPVSDPDAPFLARWSRRKLAIRHEDLGMPDPVSGRERGTSPEISNPVPVAPAPDLPDLDTIAAETDITGFLAKGVTQAVRNAALRKVWALDPAIRDYVGDARDYAYDWNTPGGVPGFGPIDPAYDVDGTLARMFSEKPRADRLEADQPEVNPVEAEQAGPESGSQARRLKHCRTIVRLQTNPRSPVTTRAANPAKSCGWSRAYPC